MKVLLVNGSPKKDGNTATALAEVARELDACGIESEVFQLGAGPIRDCIGCGGCAGKGRCVFADDVVNDLIDAAEGADGFVFGSPVYYAHPSGRILSALDRAFYAGGAAFALHFLYQHRLAKDIAAAGCGPFVHIFGHCRRRGDRVDGSDFREHVAHVGSGLIAVACYEFLFSTHCWWFMLLYFSFFETVPCG